MFFLFTTQYDFGCWKPLGVSFCPAQLSSWGRDIAATSATSGKVSEDFRSVWDPRKSRENPGTTGSFLTISSLGRNHARNHL